MRKLSLLLVGILLASISSWAGSYYTVRPNDPKAVYLTPKQFGVHADGIADDSDAIQSAIDKVQETTHEGIVLIPEGHYRVTKTINVWPSIRLIGYGAHRPVFVLADNSAGYDNPDHEKYVVFFAGSQRSRRQGATQGRLPDANAGTFYSAMSNIDIEIGDGNPGAVAVRGTYAQHSFLAHMDFRLRSGIAGVHDTGNVMEDVKFFGGRYGIWTRTPSPGWQFTAVDAEFTGQKESAIRTEDAGLTLIRPRFSKVPAAISIDAEHPEHLWIKDGLMEDVSGPAVVISMENNPRTQINMENVVCRRVPIFAMLRESGKKISASGEIYRVATFSHGLTYSAIDALPEVKTVIDSATLAQMPVPVKSDLTPLPPADTWVNIRDLGAKGDGATDDTAIFQDAINKHKAIYIPSGHYIVSDTLTLNPDTALIGLHPSSTQIKLLDRTPSFQGIGNAKPVIEAPRGGTNIMIGIGVYTNGINPRAVGVKWMSGADSLMNDVRFLGGHGTNTLDGQRENPYNNAHSADPDLNRRWDGQYPSLWVTNGGGGTFLDIWTPSTFAQSGMLVSDTSTEGRIYEMSSEHHVRYELQFHRASNWNIYSLQTEEERGEGGFALPLEISDSSNITVANLFMYRVISSYQPFAWGVKVARSKNVRFRNIYCFSNSKVSFDDSVYDETGNRELRQRNFAWLTFSSEEPRSAKAATKLEKLATGFYNASGGAVAPNGDIYFIDAKWQRIYRWDVAARQLVTVRDTPLDPANLAFDKSGNLLVVSYAGSGIVYSFKPGASENEITVLKSEPATDRPNAVPVLATSDWAFRTDESGSPLRRPYQYVSPDGTTYISATQGFIEGVTSWGVKSSDLLRSFSLTPATVGKPFYFTSESQTMTWKADVAADGNLSNVKLFTNQGGEGVISDAAGNVYIIAGQIYVYNPAGQLMKTIEVPERPTQAMFGKDGHTLFILGRTSLYALTSK